ncbi:hypothetical protein TRV_05200 [Trichophyton verrucosum HKI 0517]|uniref:Uncharacterized protein n=1 Tax=Trichophyton verrucosum (strain HKI 0517) TaxID=663202 RepID=D4DDI9_TRIVH|nr:uncharacterized protein TRV_05200 [Trichophyton verrucosum HKI 0517]EFE40056.1 hypothetical protein TRV_05200 [Trichophyton verrucosum HKI 0517]
MELISVRVKKNKVLPRHYIITAELAPPQENQKRRKKEEKKKKTKKKRRKKDEEDDDDDSERKTERQRRRCQSRLPEEGKSRGAADREREIEREREKDMRELAKRFPRPMLFLPHMLFPSFLLLLER